MLDFVVDHSFLCGLALTLVGGGVTAVILWISQWLSKSPDHGMSKIVTALAIYTGIYVAVLIFSYGVVFFSDWNVQPTPANPSPLLIRPYFPLTDLYRLLDVPTNQQQAVKSATLAWLLIGVVWFVVSAACAGLGSRRRSYAKREVADLRGWQSGGKDVDPWNWWYPIGLGICWLVWAGNLFQSPHEVGMAWINFTPTHPNPYLAVPGAVQFGIVPILTMLILLYFVPRPRRDPREDPVVVTEQAPGWGQINAAQVVYRLRDQGLLCDMLGKELEGMARNSGYAEQTTPQAEDHEIFRSLLVFSNDHNRTKLWKDQDRAISAAKTQKRGKLSLWMGKHGCGKTTAALFIALVDKARTGGHTLIVYPDLARARETVTRLRKAAATSITRHKVRVVSWVDEESSGNYADFQDDLGMIHVTDVVGFYRDFVHKLPEDYAETFFPRLKLIIFEDVETYGGVESGHLAYILQRFQRMLKSHRVEPQFIVTTSADSGGDSSFPPYVGELFRLESKPIPWVNTAQVRQRFAVLNVVDYRHLFAKLEDIGRRLHLASCLPTTLATAVVRARPLDTNYEVSVEKNSPFNDGPLAGPDEVKQTFQVWGHAAIVHRRLLEGPIREEHRTAVAELLSDQPRPDIETSRQLREQAHVSFVPATLRNLNDLSFLCSPGGRHMPVPAIDHLNVLVPIDANPFVHYLLDSARMDTAVKGRGIPDFQKEMLIPVLDTENPTILKIHLLQALRQGQLTEKELAEMFVGLCTYELFRGTVEDMKNDHWIQTEWTVRVKKVPGRAGVIVESVQRLKVTDIAPILDPKSLRSLLDASEAVQITAGNNEVIDIVDSARLFMIYYPNRVFTGPNGQVYQVPEYDKKKEVISLGEPIDVVDQGLPTVEFVQQNDSNIPNGPLRTTRISSAYGCIPIGLSEAKWTEHSIMALHIRHTMMNVKYLEEIVGTRYWRRTNPTQPLYPFSWKRQQHRLRSEFKTNAFIMKFPSEKNGFDIDAATLRGLVHAFRCVLPVLFRVPDETVDVVPYVEPQTNEEKTRVDFQLAMLGHDVQPTGIAIMDTFPGGIGVVKRLHRMDNPALQQLLRWTAEWVSRSGYMKPTWLVESERNGMFAWEQETLPSCLYIEDYRYDIERPDTLELNYDGVRRLLSRIGVPQLDQPVGAPMAPEEPEPVRMLDPEEAELAEELEVIPMGPPEDDDLQ
ncbi:MAG: hypothetical protein P9L99_11100 [Candidatus Lernaella stagnicola]|nr:hypothetical protein [Candidatus Lernaella stagnicola]